MHWLAFPLAALLFAPIFFDWDWRILRGTGDYAAERSGSFTTQEGGTGIPPTKNEGGTGIPPTKSEGGTGIPPTRR